MYSKILITGSSGFIGNEVCNFFFKKKYKVYAVDKNPPKFSDKIIFFRCDIMNKNRLFKILKNIKPDIIIHLAAKTDLDGKNIQYYKANFIGTKNIIEIANSVSSIKRVIFASSLLVNKIGTNSNDNLFYNPDTMYGQSKVLMEQVVRFSICNFKWCIIRPTTIWGDNIQNHFRTLLRLIEQRFYFNFGFKKIYKSYGYVKNTTFQIFKISLARKLFFDKKTYYLFDYIPICLNDFADKISITFRGKKNKTIPLFIAKCIALIGELFFILGYKNFPLQLRRFKNINSSFVIEPDKLKKICGTLPYNQNK
jgi:dTDP-4-dehydrorhamnose reductase